MSFFVFFSARAPKLCVRKEGESCISNKSSERRLNLSRSWHKGHSHTYNTPFYLSRLQRICLSRYLNLSFSIAWLCFCALPSAVTMLWSWTGPKSCLYLSMITSGKADILPLSRWDSDLEAFNLNPAHVSFSALTFQSTEFANYVTQRFLSY